MPDILIHPSTEALISRFVDSGHHALALVGPFGAGKAFLALETAAELLGSNKPGQIKHIKADGSIGIDDIRQVQSFLKLKVPGKAAARRAVIIEDAQTMTIEAQNALLKSLEEPPEDTRFILTLTSEKALLPTVHSRTQAVRVLPIAKKDFLAFAGNSREAERAFAISGGYAGLGLALVSDKEHQLTSAIEQAKNLLKLSAYERLTQMDQFIKDKEALTALLYALKRVLSAATQQTPEKNRLKRLVASLSAVYAAESSLQRNPNTKLLVTNLMLNL